MIRAIRRLFGKREAPIAVEPPPVPVFTPSLLVCGVNTPVCVQLLVNKTEFVLGQSERCDGALPFSDEISRRHCRILWRAGAHYIEDLGSTNGTYLNDSALEPGALAPLRAGDRLRLSASTFVVERIMSARPRYAKDAPAVDKDVSGEALG